MAAIVLCTHLSALLYCPNPSRAQGTTPKPAVERGLEYYEQSRFDEAIGLLRDLVDRGALSGDELVRAREILARSYVKKGYPAQAKDMFKALLRDNPAYRPDPIRVPPDETAVFDQALREYEAESAAPAPTPVKRDTVRAAPAPPTTPPPARPTTPVVAPVKEEGGKKPLMSQWWVWVLGAAVVGGVAAAAGGGGGGGGGPPPPATLPPPPPPPTAIGHGGGSR